MSERPGHRTKPKFLAGSLAILLASASHYAVAASFDCKKAATTVERTICANKRLSSLDEALSQAFTKLVEANAEYPPNLRDDQKDWLKSDRNHCKTSACLEGKMAARLAYLQTIPDRSYVILYPGIAGGESAAIGIDKLPDLSEATKVILAMYALENGFGCQGFDEHRHVRCTLTKTLGLGSNCSPEHLSFIRSWFKRTPNLTSRWFDKWNAETNKPGTLENLCYDQTDAGSWQNIWEYIGLKKSGDTVAVDAVQAWGSNNGHGRSLYKSIYKIENHNIRELSTEETELERSSESMFGVSDE